VKITPSYDVKQGRSPVKCRDTKLTYGDTHETDPHETDHEKLTMKRIIFIYGFIAGLVVICSVLSGLALWSGAETLRAQMWLGYLIMLIALSMIFVGIKRYRDRQLGGVIRFGTATLLGLGIAAVAGVVYVVVWEVYLAVTDYAFIDQYTQGIIAGKEAAGVSGAELEAVVESMEKMQRQYSNPLFRMPMTFLEIFPVGLLITLVSAAILRNSKTLPASSVR